MAVELTYITEKTCPLCQNTFHATKVRSKLRMIKQDTDFNTIFDQINPLYYAVFFCPNCGYAAQDTVFSDISETLGRKIRAFLQTCNVNIGFPGLRSREQAILLFKLAIFQAELIEAKSSRLAGLYLRLAWLYREAEDGAMEQLAMEKALEHYEQAMTKETFPIGNMNEVMADYLIAQLQYRLGKLDLAAKGFARIVSSVAAKHEKRIMEMSRDAWNEIKEKKKEETGESIENEG